MPRMGSSRRQDPVHLPSCRKPAKRTSRRNAHPRLARRPLPATSLAATVRGSVARHAAPCLHQDIPSPRRVQDGERRLPQTKEGRRTEVQWLFCPCRSHRLQICTRYVLSIHLSDNRHLLSSPVSPWCRVVPLCHALLSWNQHRPVWMVPVHPSLLYFARPPPRQCTPPASGMLLVLPARRRGSDGPFRGDGGVACSWPDMFTTRM